MSDSESAKHLRAAKDSLEDARTDLQRAEEVGEDDEVVDIIRKLDASVSELMEVCENVAVNAEVLEEADDGTD